MTTIESAWDKTPGYAIDLVPLEATGRVRHGELVLAESDRCLVVEESDHVDQLYFPVDDVAWEHFTPTDHHTICPFKGEADYWSLTATDSDQEHVAWTYRTPLAEVAGLAGYVGFYHDRLAVTITEAWSEDPADTVTTRLPYWGTTGDLLTVMDVQPAAQGRFVAPPHPDPPIGTFIPQLKGTHPNAGRNVVEGGQLLGDAIVAASKTVPDQRVTSAHLVFSRAAAFDAALDVDVDVLRRGRTYSTVEVKVSQHGQRRSAGMVLLDTGGDDVIRTLAEMPDVAGPDESAPLDMGVLGRDLRVVDDAYRQTPDSVGPPEINTWVRFRHAPDELHLHQALLAQSTTHWTIAAAMAPHRGVTEADAHVSLSTGIMSVTVAFHDDADVSEWLLYANRAIYAGRGQVQGEGRVFTRAGRLAASYSVHGMVRRFATDPDALGKDYSTAM